jgi:hypothetical protein
LLLGGPFGRALRSAGESLDGGLLEFDEFSPTLRRSSVFSASVITQNRPLMIT